MWVYKSVRVELSDWIRIDYYIEEELTLHEIDEMNIISITPIPNPPKLLPVGTKVRVFEEYWNRVDKDINCSWVWSITGIYLSEYEMTSDDWVDRFIVPARAVVPVLE